MTMLTLQDSAELPRGRVDQEVLGNLELFLGANVLRGHGRVRVNEDMCASIFTSRIALRATRLQMVHCPCTSSAEMRVKRRGITWSSRARNKKE